MLYAPASVSVDGMKNSGSITALADDVLITSCTLAEALSVTVNGVFTFS